MPTNYFQWMQILAYPMIFSAIIAALIVKRQALMDYRLPKIRWREFLKSTKERHQ